MKTAALKLLVLLGIMLLATFAHADPLANWHQRNPLPTADLNRTAFVGNIFAAVGSNGTIMTSPDGAIWEPQSSGTTTALKGIAYGNSTYVAVGASDTVVTSVDGTTWVPKTNASGIGTQFTGVCYGTVNGTGLFVATGDIGILSSPDGATWTLQDPTTGLNGITYGNGTFVAVGNSGRILTSPDGINWTPQAPPVGSPLYDVTYGSSGFVAVGAYRTVLSSSNGSSWTVVTSGTTSDPSLYGVAFGNSTYVAVGEFDTVVTLPAGTTTPTVRSTGSGSMFNGIAFGANSFVAIGLSSAIATSGNGSSWKSVSTTGTNPLYGLASGNGIAVAVGDNGTILTSTDGIGWAARQSGTTMPLRGVAFGNGRFVAVGDADPNPSVNSDTILYSTDGITWTRVTLSSGFSYTAVAYGNSRFVAVDQFGYVSTSTDGITWTAQTNAIPNLNNFSYSPRAITYASSSSKFVVVGDAGKIATSTDGTSWSAISTTGTISNLWGVTYGNSTLIAVGEVAALGAPGVIVKSTNGGSSWSSVSYSATGGVAAPLRAVSWDSGASVFTAAGDNGTLYTSPDGTTWTARNSGSTMRAVTSLNHTILLAGDNGVIKQSDFDLADTTNPTLSVTSPTNGSTTGAAAVTVTGTASDANGLRSITINGIQIIGNLNSFSQSVPLNMGANTITTIATDLAGNKTTDTRTVTRTQPTLTVAMNGTGVNGTNSNAVQVTYSNQSAPYSQPIQAAAGTSFTLTPMPDANSFFAGWAGGGCSGTGNCVTTLNADTTVTGTFTYVLPARISQTAVTYSSIQSAYNAASTGNTIQARVFAFPGGLTLNLGKTVSIQGGFSFDSNGVFTTNTGYSYITGGPLVINSGIVTVDRLVVQ